MVVIMNINEPNLSSLSQGVENSGPPPAGITPRPGQIVCGDIDMRIDASCTWFYQGSPFTRKALVKLFSTVLRRDDDGEHWLITPAEMCRITVDDAPFMAVELICNGKGQDQAISFRTNVDTIASLDGDHPLRMIIDDNTGEPSPYISLEHRLEAKLSRPVFYELVDLGVDEVIEGDQIYGVWSNGDFFTIGNSTDTDN